jgi:hypothetical protein
MDVRKRSFKTVLAQAGYLDPHDSSAFYDRFAGFVGISTGFTGISTPPKQRIMG